MANHAGTDQGVPDDHASDGDAKAAAQVLGNNAVKADAPEEVASASESGQLRLLPMLPILVGVLICALNVLVVARLWRTVYNSDFARFNLINLPTTVFLALITISLSIGLFLIVYAVVLRHFQQDRHKSKPPQESTPDQGAGQTPWYAVWVLVPLFVALPATALTVWAAQMIDPIAPKACIELYQEAQNIKNDNPGFRMYRYDRDQLRCAINQSVLTK